MQIRHASCTLPYSNCDSRLSHRIHLIIYPSLLSKVGGLTLHYNLHLLLFIPSLPFEKGENGEKSETLLRLDVLEQVIEINFP